MQPKAVRREIADPVKGEFQALDRLPVPIYIVCVTRGGRGGMVSVSQKATSVQINMKPFAARGNRFAPSVS